MRGNSCRFQGALTLSACLLVSPMVCGAQPPESSLATHAFAGSFFPEFLRIWRCL
jgi:hypothetical protein